MNGVVLPTHLRVEVGAVKSIALAIVRRVGQKVLDGLRSTGKCPSGAWVTPGIEDVDGQAYVLTCEVQGDMLLVTQARLRKPKPWKK